MLNISSAEELLNSPMLGAIWETFIFSELRKKYFGAWDIWFWRDRQGIEVDFLFHKGGTFDLLEVKCEVATLSRTHSLKYPQKRVNPNEIRKT